MAKGKGQTFQDMEMFFNEIFFSFEHTCKEIWIFFPFDNLQKNILYDNYDEKFNKLINVYLDNNISFRMLKDDLMSTNKLT